MKGGHVSKQSFEKDSIRLAKYTVSKLIEVESLEYKMTMCLTFINLKEDFAKSISSKIFSVTLENAMRGSEWDYMGVKVDG
ncbi:hypothetical protein RB195_017510 [Necator americanus]|uniref:Uncharacterized protein n=1 Tax=Necator americanus TaxID=51031 RepID=A0ABR1C5K4_NECAM